MIYPNVINLNRIIAEQKYECCFGPTVCRCLNCVYVEFKTKFSHCMSQSQLEFLYSIVRFDKMADGIIIGNPMNCHVF